MFLLGDEFEVSFVNHAVRASPVLTKNGFSEGMAVVREWDLMFATMVSLMEAGM